MKQKNEIQDAIEYFIESGFIEELTTDKAHYVKVLIDHAINPMQQDKARIIINYLKEHYIDTNDGRIVWKELNNNEIINYTISELKKIANLNHEI